MKQRRKRHPAEWYEPQPGDDKATLNRKCQRRFVSRDGGRASNSKRRIRFRMMKDALEEINEVKLSHISRQITDGKEKGDS